MDWTTDKNECSAVRTVKYRNPVLVEKLESCKERLQILNLE